MQIRNFLSSSQNGRARVSATVTWEDTNRPPFDVYYETAGEFADGLVCNPDAFLVAAALPAWHHGEKRLRIESEVCPELVQGIGTAMEVIGNWYRKPHPPVCIEAPPRRRLLSVVSARSGSFLSGGIDSLATLRANHLRFPAGHPGRILDGFLVFGLEIDRMESFDHAMSALREIADDAGVTLVPVYTDVRYLEEDWVFWQHEFQGAVLASVAHAFTGRLTVVSIGSTDDIPHLTPYGSHPMLDPNYTSFDLRIRHDGVDMSRLEKTRIVADWDAALKNIRVCNDTNRYSKGRINCGECDKCVRTMLALEGIGALERTGAFGSRPLTPELVQKAYLDEANFHFYTQVMPYLARRGRLDLLAVLERQLKALRGEAGWRGPVKRFDRRYFSGHLAPAIRSMLSRKSSRET